MSASLSDKAQPKGQAEGSNTANEGHETLLETAREAYFKGNLNAAEDLYRRAASTKNDSIPALEGIACVQMGSSDFQNGAETYASLVGMAEQQGNVPKQREFLWRTAEAHDRLGELDKAEDALRKLIQTPLESEAQLVEALCFLADLQYKMERARQDQRLEKYWKQEERRKDSIKRSRSKLRLQVDAERSDEQLAEEGSRAHTLHEIVTRTIPSPPYARYFEHHLQLYLSCLGNYPPRSAARQERRMAALKECAKMVTTSAGGCTTAFPFEAAIWLLEEQEELFGGTFPVRTTQERRSMDFSRSSIAVQTRLKWYRGNSIHRFSIDRLNIGNTQMEPSVEEDDESTQPVTTKHESFGVKLAHQFPWLGSASVAIGLALRRRFLSDPYAPSTAVRRKQIVGALRRGVAAGADSAAGWKALAELQYQTRQWQEAYNTSCDGLEWSARRRHAGHETLTGFALSLRLCAARCLRRLNRLEEAEATFKVLAGWTTDGECGFDELSGSAPTSIRQQAMRGIAKIALQRKERQLAKAQYERILGKALMGRGTPAEHWAHAEYAWLQFEDGDLMTAKSHMEKAVAEAQKEGCRVTDSEVAEHHYKLGRVLWAMGGKFKTDPQKAMASLEAASLEESDSQAMACAYLGHWYREVRGDLRKAKNCYEDALLIDPKAEGVADSLKKVNEELGLNDQGSEAAGKSVLTIQATPSAFAAQSQEGFEKLPPKDKQELGRIVSDLADRVSSGRFTMQTAHSANSELAGYSVVSRRARQ